MRQFALVVTLVLSAIVSLPNTAFGYETKVSKVVTGEPEAPHVKPRVLIIGTTEYNAVTSGAGAGVVMGHVALGEASKSTSYTEHSEVWEATRRFMNDCKGITPITDANQPHDLTVKMDSQPFVTMWSSTSVYQLITLSPNGTPIFITPKLHLRNDIKSTCKAILGYVASQAATQAQATK